MIDHCLTLHVFSTTFFVPRVYRGPLFTRYALGTSLSMCVSSDWPFVRPSSSLFWSYMRSSSTNHNFPLPPIRFHEVENHNCVVRVSIRPSLVIGPGIYFQLEWILAARLPCQGWTRCVLRPSSCLNASSADACNCR